MPYTSCPECGVTTYVVTQDDCPCCGARLVARGPAAGPRPAAAPRLVVRRALQIARERMDADAVVLTEIADEHETVREVVQDGAFPAITAGISAPLGDTICRRLLEGRIGNLVGDVSAEPELRDLPAVHDHGIGSYVGVPLTAADARLYAVCCLARDARRDLGDDDVEFLRRLCGRIRVTLDAASVAAH
jgi:GAF domain-containing protein